MIALALAGCGGGSDCRDASVSADRVQLGRMIFGDGNLSEPRGTACLACHQPNMGFAGNHGGTLGVAVGSRPGASGLRNAMTNSYAGFVPEFAFETVNSMTSFSAPETRGMALFRDAGKANWAGCPLMNPDSGRPEAKRGWMDAFNGRPPRGRGPARRALKTAFLQA